MYYFFISLLLAKCTKNDTIITIFNSEVIFLRNPNGYGSVIKMSGKRRKPYGVRITVGRKDNGRQIYKYLGYYESQQAAIIALAEYNKTPYDIDANNITFAEVYQRYSKEENDNISSSLKKLNKTCFNHCKLLHLAIFKDLRKAHLKGVIDDLETPTAKSNVASFFRKLYKYAIENDITHKNYAEFITTPTKNKKTDSIPFLREEINLLWDNIGNINAEILIILAYSGMRIMELLTLEKSQINMEENYIITGSKSPAGKDRYIPIHPRIKPLIEKHYANSSKWLIVNKQGDKPIRYDSFHAKRWKKLKNKLQLRDGLTPHSTRHFFISELHRLGADKIAVQKIVGHKGDDITEQAYTHINKIDLHAVTALIE